MARHLFAVPAALWLLGGIHCPFWQAMLPLAAWGALCLGGRWLMVRRLTRRA